MNAQQLGKQPMSAVLDIVEQLKQRDDLADFFAQARSLLPETSKNSSSDEPEPSQAAS
jgi:hypothetical protein